MQKITYTALALSSLMLVPLAQAEPLSLSPAEMDRVTAGVRLVISGGTGTGGTGGAAAASAAALAAIEATCRSNCSIGAGTIVETAVVANGGTGGTGTGGSIDLDLSSLFGNNGNGSIPLSR